MVLSFSLSAAAVVAIIVECILYGFSLALFGVTLWALIYKRSGRQISRVMCTATMLLFILSTMHIVVDARRVYEGFVKAESAAAYFGDTRRETWKNAIYGVETYLADAVLIYRCYIVWDRRWIVIVPIIGWCSVVVAGIHTVWSIAQLVANPNDIYAIQTGRWVISFYSLALATNLVATGILAFRLWSVNREIAKTRASRTTLYPIMCTIVECGALYSVTLIVMLATYESKSNGAYVVIDIIGQVIPITFYLVITRAAMIRMQTHVTTQLQLSEPRFAFRSGVSSTVGTSDATGTVSKPVEVRIAQFVDHDHDASTESPYTKDPEIV